MRPCIRTESAPSGKPVVREVHKAEGRARFKEHVLIVVEVPLAGIVPGAVPLFLFAFSGFQADLHHTRHHNT